MTRYTPLWEQAGSYPASVDRSLIASVAGAAGYPLVRGCAVTVSAGTMNMNIAPGAVIVPTPNNTGSVSCYSDAVEVVTSPVAPASGSNRIDVVICQARGNDLDGGSNNDFLFQVIAGAAATAGSEVVPATPAGAVALAQVRVIGGAASLNAANLIDRRILQPWAEPWGIQAAVIDPVGQTSIGAEGDFAHPTPLTWNALANRRYRVSICTGWLGMTAPPGYMQLFICDAANTHLATCVATGRAASHDDQGSWYVEEVEVPTVPGPLTRHIRGASTSGTYQTVAAATQPTVFAVEDAGPAGAPVL
jgi:hypothetical protein